MSKAHSEQEKVMLGLERIKLLQNPAECWFNLPCCLRMASKHWSSDDFAPILGILAEGVNPCSTVFLCTGEEVSTGSAPSYSIFFSLYNLNSCFDVPSSVATAAAILHVSVQRPSQPSRLSPRELWDTVSVGWAGSFGLPCKNCIASQNRGMQPVLTLFKTHCNLGFFSS